MVVKAAAFAAAMTAANVEPVYENGDGAGFKLAKKVSRLRHSMLEATAYHEAGHAVAAVFQAVRFEYVTIEADPTRGNAGHIARSFRKPKTLEHFYADGVMTMAGEAAQRRFRSSSVRRHHSGGDREAAVDLALRAGCDGPQAELLVKLWGLKAEALVEMRWPQISQVALALIDRRRLTEAEVREVTMKRPAVSSQLAMSPA